MNSRWAAAALVAAAGVAACGSTSHKASAPPTTAVTANATTVATDMILAGLPATLSMTYTAATDPNNLLGRQGGYTSKVSLQDRRLPKGSLNDSTTAGGASIECYPDKAAAQSRTTYLKAFQPPVGDGYDYTAGACVLRVDAALTPAEAAQYNQLFQAAS